MFNLLKTDLKRSFKDKLFLILLIIAGAFALATPLLYKGIFMLLELDAESLKGMEMFGLSMDAKTMFFSSFSLSNNFGFILPIFIAIILCKDFSNGTIRNKIICGKSRTSIYFSLFITCVILICSFILFHALLTLLVSLIFFDYQTTAFTIKDFGYLIASLGLEILVYVLISAIITFFIVCMKNTGLSIVMYFAVAFALIILGSITQTTIMFAEETSSFSFQILEFLNTANVFANTSIGMGITYKLKELLYLIIPNVVFAITIVICGLLIFRKKDLK